MVHVMGSKMLQRSITWLLPLGLAALWAGSCIPDATLSPGVGGEGGSGALGGGGSGGGGATGGTTTTGGGGSGGGGNTCDPEQCPGVDTTCNYRTCVGDCGFADAPEGTACTEDGGQVCDGQGSCVECNEASDCDSSELCVANQCVPATCQNGTQDGQETDEDCGGNECPPCDNGEGCAQYTDCVSRYCDGTTCAACSDHGHCAAAPDSYCDSSLNGGQCVAQKTLGALCSEDAECRDGNCPADDGMCCDAACGGACEACAAAKTCNVNGICAPVIAGTDPDDECASELDCFAGQCLQGTVAFVTSSLYDGDLGGLSGADGICQTHATNTCLPGTHMAWLSSSSASPNTRFSQQTTPYRLVDGTKIADSWTDLSDGTLDAPLDLDEYGDPPPASIQRCDDKTAWAWSGTRSAGEPWVEDPTVHCDDWSSTSAEGSWGGWGETNQLWTSYCYSHGGGACQSTASIYCFEQ
jgi:hypothetical protein